MSSYDSSDSPLRGSSLMIEASEIWERFTTTKLGKEGDIQSIYELGMGLKKCHKDGIEYEEVYFEDESVFPCEHSCSDSHWTDFTDVVGRDRGKDQRK